MASIVPVVEGPGDLAALPPLLRRILGERLGRYDIGVVKPKSAKGRSTLLKRFEDFLSYAAFESDCVAILVLLDSDENCPITLTNDLTPRCNQGGLTQPVAIVCARREYEAWFLASLDTIKGHAEIPETASIAGNVEDVRNPKQWLTDQMPAGRKYKETSHQASLTPLIDLNLAHANSRSFRRLCHAVEELVGAVDNGTRIVTPSRQ